METQQTTQNVRAEIIALEVGAEADFPILRYEYVLSCRTKLAKALSRTFDSRTATNTENETRVFIKRTY